MNNYDNKSDKIIIVSNNSDYSESIFKEITNKLNLNGVNFENYVLDYRLNSENLNKIIQEINPKFQLSNDITEDYKEINLISNDIYIDKNLSYNNSYLLSNNNKGILNQITNNSELDLDITKEQLRYNIILTNKKDCNFVSGSEHKSKKGRKKKGNDNKGDNEDNNMNIEEEIEETYAEYNPVSLDESEEILGKYLEMNDMEITEYLKDENSIEITIYNKNKKTYTEIKINNYYQDNKDNLNVDNDKDSKKGKGSKTKLGKKSKSKEKKNNQMEIEEIKNSQNEEEMPSIDINSEDIDDSLFLNTLFNSIFI